MYSVVFSVMESRMESRVKVYSRFKIKKSENGISSVLAIRYIILLYFAYNYPKTPHDVKIGLKIF